LIPGDGEAIAGLLRDYLDARLRFDDGDAVHQQAARVESEQLQERLWSRAGGIAQQDPRAITSGLLLQALNETFDLASARMAALTLASARLCAAASASKPSPCTASRATVRPERVPPFATLRMVHTASMTTASPGIESKRWTAIVTR